MSLDGYQKRNGWKNMKNLANSLSKYTGLSVEELEQAFEAVQDEIFEDVKEMLADYVQYIDYEQDSEGVYILTDNFEEKFLYALFTEYNLEAK